MTAGKPTRLLLLNLVLFGLALLTPPQAVLTQERAENLFQQALRMERMNGDLEGAIRLYQQVVATGNRTMAARALIRTGGCYEKLGQQDAQEAYLRVIREFGDQEEQVALAQEKLAALSQPSIASEPTIQVRLLMSGRYPDSVDISGSPHPDGRHLAYVDWSDGSVALRDLRTGESRTITQGDWEKGYPDGPIVSPDGEKITYHFWPSDDGPIDHSPGIMLRVVGIDGAGDRPLGVVSGVASWSPDSRYLVASRPGTDSDEAEIVRISVADGQATPLATIPCSGRFGPDLSHSPDGRFLAFDFPVEADSARSDLGLISSEGGRILPLVDHPGHDQLFGWVPGTDMVLFTSDRTGDKDLWAVQVTQEGTAGTPFPVRRDFGEGRPMGFAADGSLFYSIYTLQYVKKVAPYDEKTGTVLLDQGETLRGTHDNNKSAWSPDGRRLILAYREEGEGNQREWFTIRVRDLDTGTERVLTRDINPATVAGPQWLPDGRSILVVGRRDETGEEKWEDQTTAVFRVDVTTAEITRLFDIPSTEDWWFSIGLIPTPDGEGVYYIHDGRLALRDIESGLEEELFLHPGLASGVLALSPDGSELLVGVADSTTMGDRPPPMPTQGGRLMALPTSGGVPREVAKLTEPGQVRGAGWTTDGTHIRFIWGGEEGAVLMSVPRDGGVAEPIWQTDLRLASLVPSPDGRQVTYMTQTNEAEIWVMENLREFLRRRSGGR